MANKQDLITLMAGKSGQTKKDAEVSLKALIESIEELVANGEKVQLVGFGSFEPVERKERETFKDPRNKELGKKIVPAKNVPVFKAGKEFKDKVKNAK